MDEMNDLDDFDESFGTSSLNSNNKVDESLERDAFDDLDEL